jgi:hydroxymethylbilane synthase
MIRIGTRGSKLALSQADFLASELNSIGATTSIQLTKTNGAQLEDALITHEIDVAIHPLSDLPTTQAEDLVIAGVSTRHAANDLLIIKKEAVDTNQILNLQSGALIGTSSIRRKLFLKNLKPDVQFTDLRGDTSILLEDILAQNLDGIVVAKADVDGFSQNLDAFHLQILNPIEFVPSPAQGVLAYQTRKNDIETRKIIHQIHNSAVSALTNVERTVQKLFNGGKHLALGVYCSVDANNFYHCYGMYAHNLDSKPTFHRISQSTTHKLAERMYEALSKNNK